MAAAPGGVAGELVEGDDCDLLVLELIPGCNLVAAAAQGLSTTDTLRIAESIAGEVTVDRSGEEAQLARIERLKGTIAEIDFVEADGGKPLLGSRTTKTSRRRRARERDSGGEASAALRGSRDLA